MGCFLVNFSGRKKLLNLMLQCYWNNGPQAKWQDQYWCEREDLAGPTTAELISETKWMQLVSLQSIQYLKFHILLNMVVITVSFVKGDLKEVHVSEHSAYKNTLYDHRSVSRQGISQSRQIFTRALLRDNCSNTREGKCYLSGRGPWGTQVPALPQKPDDHSMACWPPGSY